MLDGSKHDYLLKLYDMRCRDERENKLNKIYQNCEKSTFNICFNEMNILLNNVENCYRQWHKVNKTIIYSMSEFSNAIIYAFRFFILFNF